MQPLGKYFWHGETLEENLAFANHYHSTKMNQIFHIISTPLVCFFFFSFILQTPIIGSVLAFITFVGYMIVFFSWDFYVGVAWMLLFGLIYNLSIGYSLVTLGLFWPFNLLFALLFFIFQFTGHLFFEPSHFPSFTAFEAFVTTPYLHMLIVLSYVFKYKVEYLEGIHKMSKEVKIIQTTNYSLIAFLTSMILFIVASTICLLFLTVLFTTGSLVGYFYKFQYYYVFIICAALLMLMCVLFTFCGFIVVVTFACFTLTGGIYKKNLDPHSFDKSDLKDPLIKMDTV